MFTFSTICVDKLKGFEDCNWIVSHKVQLSNITDECVVNALEATPRRCSILGVFWGIYGESTGAGGTHAEK